MDRTERKNVLITGVSSGLGLGLAKVFLQQNWTVYGLSRAEPKALIGKENFHFSSIDLAQTERIQEKLQGLVAGASNFHLVILNAGIIGRFGDMSAVPLKTMKAVMEVNLWANKVILDTLVTSEIQMRQVVAISSGASTSGSRGWNAYGISKAALNMLIKLYAKEQVNTHFCSLAPGLVDSNMQDYLCGLDMGENFQTLEILKSKRKTPEMPSPDAAAETLVKSFADIFTRVPSGDFADIRTLRPD